MPVTPAEIRWRLTRAGQPIVTWQSATDHTSSLHPNVQGDPPTDVNFASVYAPDTTQNNPNQPGIYHFWLKRGFDTRSHPNGSYQLEVQASDVRGNRSNGTLSLTIANTGVALS
jgi:hypothetical protein